jgi:malate synthase
LLRVAEGTITEAGLRLNLNVGVQYLEAWLGGQGCVPLYNLMEDAATAEISRAQLWQWRRHGAEMTGGGRIDEALIRLLMAEEMAKIEELAGEARFAAGHYGAASAMFLDMVTADEFEDFLTLPAYEQVVAAERELV